MADDISQAAGTGESARDGASNTSAAPAQGQAVSAPLAPTNVSADITRILKEVKLPERRHPASEPKPAAKIPVEIATTPAATVPTPPQSSAPSRAPAAPQNLSAAMASEKTGADSAEATPSPIVSLHTMKTDLQNIVREQKISLVHAASMEADRQNARQPPTLVASQGSAPKRATFLMLAAAIVLLGLGGAALFAIYSVMHARGSSQTPVSPSLLFAENQISLPINDQSSSALKQTLGGMLAGFSSSVGSITQIVPTTVTVDPQTLQQSERQATLSELFLGLGAHPPDDLVRALSSNFFFGIHAADVPAPLFVIPVVSYDRAFAGMLAWEGAMDADLSPLFKQVPAITAGDQGLPAQRQFVDLVVRNYDARALKDDTGAVVLYYSFPTPKLLIIAASPYTFPEVLSRLRAERKL